VGANPLAWLIPCHRVIRQLGEIGNYRWGEVTKRAMLGREACHAFTALPSLAAVDAQVGP
jgi:AraC family transcriptional regulator of adaptative response/methylated-DNA-[protein]-cysteine methyltransferase